MPGRVRANRPSREEESGGMPATGSKARESGSRPARRERLAMQLIPDDIRVRLLANGAAFLSDESFDPEPVVKLFTPDAGATWLLASLDPEDPDVAFGLCDLGVGFPELGTVSLAEIAEVRGAIGLPVERDLLFAADRPLSRYESDATALGAIRV